MQETTNKHWIRARDGALYANPRFDLAEGHVQFGRPVTVPPRFVELLLWVPDVEDDERYVDQLRRAQAIIDKAPEILQRVFGPGGAEIVDRDALRPRQPRGLPLPIPPCPAVAFSIFVLRRIPVPDEHEGCERYRSRCVGPVMDFPPGKRDAYEIE